MPEALIDTPVKLLFDYCSIDSHSLCPCDFANPDKNLWSAFESCYFPFLKIYSAIFVYQMLAGSSREHYSTSKRGLQHLRTSCPALKLSC